MSQLFIRRKPNQQIPEDFFALCPKRIYGVAIVADNKLETMRGENLDLETLRATEEDFKDVPITIFLSDRQEYATNLEAVPPYDLIGNDDDEPLVTLFADGEFPGYVKEKSALPGSFHLAAVIADHCETVFDAVEKDLGKLMNKLSQDNFKEKIKMNSVSRGYLMFVAQNGGCIQINQGETAKEFPWGWVSDTLGYGAEAPKEEKPAKKPGLFSKKSTVRETFHQPSNNVVAAGADKTPPTETAVKAPPAESKPVKPTGLTLQNITVKAVGIPTNYPRKRAKNWIKERIGHCPPNYQEPGAKFNMYFGPDGKQLTLAQVKEALGMSAAGLPKLDNPKAENQKDIEPKNIDSSKLVSDPLPILSPASRERFQRYLSDERVKKIIAENGDLITDPDNVQGYEGKIPPFANQLQMKDMSDFDALPFKEFEAIGRTNIHDLAVVCYTYKQRALKAELRLTKFEKKVEPKKEEEVVQPTETKVKKPGLFARKAAA